MFNSAFETLGMKLVGLTLRAWQSNGRGVRAFIVFATFMVWVGAGLIVYDQVRALKSVASLVAGGALMGVGVTFIVVVAAMQEGIEVRKKQDEKKEIVSQAQASLKDPEKAPGAAWELAQFKIEEYLDKNIQQVSWIFRLVLLVCFCGFLLILSGVGLAIANKDQQLPAILAASSGVMVSFVSATFLVVYKNAMEQAKEYMQILERINAVGVSVSILQTVSQSSAVQKDQALIDVSKQLLLMYSHTTNGPAKTENRAKVVTKQ